MKGSACKKAREKLKLDGSFVKRIILNAANLRLCDKRWKRDSRLHHVIYIRCSLSTACWPNEFHFDAKTFKSNTMRTYSHTHYPKWTQTNGKKRWKHRERKSEKNHFFQLIFATGAHYCWQRNRLRSTINATNYFSWARNEEINYKFGCWHPWAGGKTEC